MYSACVCIASWLLVMRVPCIKVHVQFLCAMSVYVVLMCVHSSSVCSTCVRKVLVYALLRVYWS